MSGELDQARAQITNNQTDKVMQENAGLKEQLAQAQDQIKALSATGTDSKVSGLQDQLRTVQQRLDEQVTENASWKASNSALQQELAQVKESLANAQKQQAQLAPNGGGEVQHENEVLRGYITRLTQDESRREAARQIVEEEMQNLKINSAVLNAQIKILGSPVTELTAEEKAALQNPAPTLLAESNNNLIANKNAVPDSGGTPPPSVSSPSTNATPMPDGTVAANSSATVSIPSVASQLLSTNSTPPPETQPAATPVLTSASPNLPEATPPNSATPSKANPVSADAPKEPPDNSPTTSIIPPPETTVTDQTVRHEPPAPDPNTPDQNASPDGKSSAPPTSDAADVDPTELATTLKIPNEMTVYAQKGNDLFKNGRYDDAAAQYQLIIDKYPESLYAWSNLAVVRYQQQNMPEAMRLLQQAIKLAPNDAMSHRNLGIIYYQLNRPESAIDELNRAIALDPTDAFSYNYLGSACFSKGWVEPAEKNFLKAVELRDNLGDGYMNLALVYSSMRPPQMEKARMEYKRALLLGCPKMDRLEKMLNSPDVQ